MLKYLNLEGLYEEIVDKLGEEKADELDEAIREDYEFFKISENKYGTSAFFKEENQKNIFKKYPNLKDTSIDTFEEYIQEYYSEEFEDFIIGGLQIDEDSILDYIKESYEEMNFYSDDLWNSEDFDEKFKQINSRIIGEFISLKLNEILEEFMQSDYTPDWDTILTNVPDAYKIYKFTPKGTGIANFIEKTMRKKGYTKTWVAGVCDINYKTFCDKLKRNSFDALELLKLGNALEIDLNELKNNIQKITLPSK